MMTGHDQCPAPSCSLSCAAAACFPFCVVQGDTAAVAAAVHLIEGSFFVGLDGLWQRLAIQPIDGVPNLIERFVDPNDPELPDFANAPDQSLDDFYRVRVMERREFNPR